MVAKPDKCWTFGLIDRRSLPKDHKQHGVSYGPFNPEIKINNELIKYLEDKAFKYLGRFMYANLKEKEILHKVSEEFNTWMKTVDDEPISGASKA